MPWKPSGGQSRPGSTGNSISDRKKRITQRWGWAKRTFLANQYRAGSSVFNANSLWARRRNWLRSRGVQWPEDIHTEAFRHGERDIFEENTYGGQEQPPDLQQEYDPNPKSTRDYSRQKDESDRAYYDRVSGYAQEDIELENIQEFLQEHANEFDEGFEDLGDIEVEPIQADQQQHHQDSLEEFPFGHREPGETKHGGTKAKKTKTGTSDVIEPDIPMADKPGPSDSKKRKPDDGGDDDDEEMPDITNGSDAGGEGSPGRNETMGMGGAGGGLAGAGNNAFFKGFAGSTKEHCPNDFSYVQTYKRPFAIHTEFVQEEGETLGASMTGPIDTTADSAVAAPLGFPTQYIKADCDHGGVHIPYFFMEASMKTRDWNKRNDHVAYKVEEFGFNVPNLRLSVMNNDRSDVTQVAPAPPADARMWVFVDINNDYGIPQSYSNESSSHNTFFTHEDILDPDGGDYNLPMLGRRSFLLDPTVAMTIKSDRAWELGITEWLSDDANALYDMKRHPGYHEFILSKAKMGLSYKPNSPIVRLPHMPQTSLDWGCRQPFLDDGNLWDMVNANPQLDPPREPQLHQWHSVYAPYLQNTADDPNPATAMDGMINYYCANMSAYTKNIGDSLPMTAAQQTVHDQVGSEPVRPTGNPAVALNAASAITRTKGRYNVSDDGTHHSKHISKRPPIFTFGIHKELEDQPTGFKFWRYYCYGQVEYFCRIRWYVKPCLFKSYIPVGPGGLYTTFAANPAANETAYGRKGQLMARRPFRAGHKFMLNTTDKEAPESAQTTFY